jgi:hypothetical protein
MAAKDDKLDKVLEFAARMDERHLALAKSVEDVKTQVTHGFEAIGNRVSKLEAFKNRALGYASGASIAVTATYHFVSLLFKSGGAK